jgi:hypothetical protein
MSTDEQHHVIAATQTLLYDTNSLDAENTEALIGARRAVALIKELPPLVRIFYSLSALSIPHRNLGSPNAFATPTWRWSDTQNAILCLTQRLGLFELR